MKDAVIAATHHLCPEDRVALVVFDNEVEGLHELAHVTELRRRGIDTTTIGVGHYFDEMLLSGMAEAGGGAFAYIAETSALFRFFENEIAGLINAVASRHN